VRIWIFKWRASLVPAAAVIPAPLAYTIIVAVKRLVVGLNKLICSTHTLRTELTYSTLWTNQNVSNMSYTLTRIVCSVMECCPKDLYTHIDTAYMSMGIVGINSTTGRAVKCIDPSKTTKSESSWLGYTLCAALITRILIHAHIYAQYIHVYTYKRSTLYNEERRLGDQRGSDTLVVPLVTSNYGLSIALSLTVTSNYLYDSHTLTCKSVMTWAFPLVTTNLYLVSI